jgi:hypothetical protein
LKPVGCPKIQTEFEISMLKRIASLVVVSFVVACGGGGGDAGTSPFVAGSGPTGSTVQQPTNLVLQLDKASVGNSGSDGVAVTVTATDANNNVVPSAPVSIAADASAVVVTASPTTDAGGKVTANVLVGTENRSNRTVTVTATSGSVVRTQTFVVIGSKIASTVIGSPSAPGATGQVNYVLTDVNSNPMANQPISVAGIGAAVTGTTDTNGAYVYKFTAPATAADYAITASAGGTTRVDTVKVATAATVGVVPAGSILSASVSANPSVVSVNTASTSNQAAIRALFLGPNNAPVKDVRVRFDLPDPNSVGGNFSTGAKSVKVFSDASGQATTAYVPEARFSPTDGVIVRACYGYTDADVDGTNCPYSTSTTLTVVSEAISVSIGTNSRLIDNTLTYIQEFVVTVVDSSGRAKAGVQITPSIDLLRFGKGQWTRGGSGWVLASTSAPQYFYNQNRTFWYLEDPRTAIEKAADPAGVPLLDARAACWNEDRNRNGVLEAAEDSKSAGYSLASGGNGNGKLDPAKSDVAISIPGASTTDASGKVVLRIEYAKNLGSWLEYKILVSASGVGGTEGRATWTDVLSVLAADATDTTVVPPFANSRYGILPGCDVAQ